MTDKHTRKCSTSLAIGQMKIKTTTRYHYTSIGIDPESTSEHLLSTSGPLSTCPNHPRARHQTTRDSPCVPEPTEIIQAAQSYLAHTALLIPSCRNHSRGSCPQLFPFSLLLLPTLRSPRVTPRGSCE